MPKSVCCLLAYTDRRDFSVSRKPIFGDKWVAAVSRKNGYLQIGVLLSDNVQGG